MVNKKKVTSVKRGRVTKKKSELAGDDFEEKKFTKVKKSKSSENFSGIFSNKYLIAFVILFGILFLFLAYSFFTFEPSFSPSLEYVFGDPLSGVVELTLARGNFIPADSIVSVSLGNQQTSLSLSELINIDSTSGDFYLNGVLLNGSGEGYGLPGVKITYPDVFFDLIVLDVFEEENDSGMEFFVIAENLKSPKKEVVKARSSRFDKFRYNFSVGETVVIDEKSVRVDDVAVDSDVLDVVVDVNTVTVTTNFSEEEEGFGEGYVLNDGDSDGLEIPQPKISQPEQLSQPYLKPH